MAANQQGMQEITPDAREDVLALHCHFVSKADGRPCGCRIDVGFMTTCKYKHVFCQTHADEWFARSDCCPCCPNGGSVRMLKMDFAKPQKESSLALLGLPPVDILSASCNAFQFWSSQKAMEYKWTQEADSRLRTKEERDKRNYFSQATQAKKILARLSNDIESLKQRKQSGLSRREAIRNEFAQARERLRKGKQVLGSLREGRQRIVGDRRRAEAPQRDGEAWPSRHHRVPSAASQQQQQRQQPLSPQPPRQPLKGLKRSGGGLSGLSAGPLFNESASAGMPPSLRGQLDYNGTASAGALSSLRRYDGSVSAGGLMSGSRFKRRRIT